MVGDTSVMPSTGPITSEHTDVSVQQILTFEDASPSGAVMFPPLSDSTYDVGSMQQGSLDEFFQRPVKIHEADWVEGSPLVAGDIAPWHLYFNQTAVKKKLDNYALLQCNLHVKVVINASPFYYGALLFSYQPLPLYSNSIPFGNAELENCAYTQRPHFIVYPANNQGGEMVLPFVCPVNWLRVGLATDFVNMGTIHIREIIGLANANGVSGATINVQVYAWASNVRLSTPTASLAVQAGSKKKKDEYGQGPISRVASAVANIASKLKTVPMLMPFATATEIGANAVSGIASIFGFTNVPVISDVMPVSICPGHGIPSSGLAVPAAKLTLDPKNELSIDPRTVGLSGGDEFAISNIVGRESLLFKVDWSTTDPKNAFLASLPISPIYMMHRTNGVSQDIAQLTPMALAASMFELWHGDIIIRIRAVCSQYHKGRVKITWDPTKDIVTDGTDYSNTAFTKIVDLTPDLDYEIRVPFSQAQHWLEIPQIRTMFTFNRWRRKGDILASYTQDGFTNGTLTIRVLSVLTAPVATSDAHFLIFVRGAENLQFMNPVSGYDTRQSYYTVQSGNKVSEAAEDDASSYRVYGGEAVGSLRVLLRRSYYVPPITWIDKTIDPATHTGAVLRANFSQFPPQPGFQPDSPYDLSRVLAAGVLPGNVVPFAPFTLLIPCFIGFRGSMIWHLAPDQSEWQKEFTTIITRGDGNLPGSGAPFRVSEALISTTTAVTPGPLKQFYTSNKYNGASGSLPFASGVSPIDSVSTPFYRSTRMQPTRLSYGYSLGNDAVPSSQESRFTDDGFITVVIPLKPTIVNECQNYSVKRWYSIGTDFTAFGFLNVPVMYSYTVAPIAS